MRLQLQIAVLNIILNYDCGFVLMSILAYQQFQLQELHNSATRALGNKSQTLVKPTALCCHGSTTVNTLQWFP